MQLTMQLTVVINARHAETNVVATCWPVSTEVFRPCRFLISLIEFSKSVLFAFAHAARCLRKLSTALQADYPRSDHLQNNLQLGNVLKLRIQLVVEFLEHGTTLLYIGTAAANATPSRLF